MRRSAWIFLAAILLPSLGLAWLAIHSVSDQQVVLQHQEAIICQNQTDALAKDIQQQMDAVRLDFVNTTRQLQEDSASPRAPADEFNQKLRAAWPLAEIGFAVDLNGEIYSPQSREDARARQFRTDNDRFLSNRENAEVYFFNGNNQAVTANTSNFNTYSSITRNGVPDNGAKQWNDRQEAKSKTTISGLVALADADTSDEKERAKKVVLDKPKVEGNALKSEVSPKANAPMNQPTRRALETGSADKTGQAEKAPGAPAGQSQRSDEPRDLVSTGGAVLAQPVTAPTLPTGDDIAKDGLEANKAIPQSTSTPVSTTAPPSAPAPVTATSAAAATLNLPGTAGDSGSALNAPATEILPRSSSIQQQLTKNVRSVVPQQKMDKETVSLSNTVPAESDFRQVIGNEASGALARFLDNKLCLIVWSHAPPDSSIVFGAQLDKTKLVEKLRSAFQIPELERSNYSRSADSNYCVAILDDTGHPVAISRSGFKADWKHPFVATEIGEALPHWEAALYLVDPEQINRTARTLQFTLGLIVLLLVAAIVSGGSLIASDVRRQVRLAQQKTDFVSNVSHELKTPLTSIRMFADLLAEKRVPDEARQSTYLRIIAAEAARLTRLINNVLDFARLERGAPTGEHQACDLVEAVRDVIETCQPHLETSGVSFRSEIETDTLPLTGDRDSLAQIILNLVSNAEKYGGNDITVRVRQQETSAGVLGCVDVLDRGAGISARDMKTIFEPFHRLDDSLSSGIPGSGLGLTLARRMARAHGGDITCSARAGGGTCFTLSVPLTNQPPKNT